MGFPWHGFLLAGLWRTGSTVAARSRRFGFGVVAPGAGLLQQAGLRLCLCLASVLIAAGLALLAAAPAHAASEGDLRLSGGNSLAQHEGRLEIFHSGEWGAVCDDDFVQQEATVACKQLGFTGAQTHVRGFGGPSSLRIWLDDVACDGTEMSLSECSHLPWGEHNCGSDEDVGVRCEEATTAPAILIGKRKLKIDEEDSATYTVKLGKLPTGNVTVTVGGITGTDLTVTPASFMLTTSTWSTGQTVTVTAGDDADTTRDTATLTHSASGGGYVSVTGPTVAVDVNDNDDKGVSVSPQSMTLLEDVGPLVYSRKRDDTYSVVLTGKPSADVTITISKSTGAELSLTDSAGNSVSTLTFTTDDWSTAQKVTVTPTYDEDLEDDVATLTHSASGGGYGDVTIPGVTVRVEDLYERGIQLLWYHTTVYEQHSSGGSYGVVMSGPPAESVTITIRVPEGLNLSVTPQTLRFTANNWRPAKMVVVRQGNDGNAEHERVQFTHTASGDDFESETIPSIELLLVDDDNEGLPGRPRDVRGTSGEGSVGLKWTPPLEDPEKPVLNYEYQQDGETGWTPTGGPETTKDVTGLTNGESYKFRVRAVNAEGTGSASEPSAPVTPEAPGLTAEFTSVPASHDGSSRFVLRLVFSEAVKTGVRKMRDHVFEVAGGAVKKVRRVEKGSNIGWNVTVAPDTDGTISVTLPVHACGESGAVCTYDGGSLQEAISVTVPGPASVLPEVSISAGSSPVTEGTSAAFTLSRTGDTAAALTVAVSVNEAGSVFSGVPPRAVTFAAGSAAATLSVATDDDAVAEADGRVTASVSAGSGYEVDADAASAGVDVYDNDEAASTAVETLWTSTMTVRAAM